MAGMFTTALLRMANGEKKHVLPITTRKEGAEGQVRDIFGYMFEWTERLGVDPEDFIICKYRVIDPDDVAQIKAAFERKQSIEDMAKAQR